MERVLFADIDCVRVGRQEGLTAATCISSQGSGRNVLGLELESKSQGQAGHACPGLPPQCWAPVQWGGQWAGLASFSSAWAELDLRLLGF